MTMKPEEVLQLTTALLAGMDSEPVAVIDKEGSPMTRAECNDDRVFAICCKVGTPLYAAPPAPVMPAELHSDTQKLVAEFCTALAEKLYKAQLKYGYSANWKYDNWQADCQAHFHQHITKGDPRDVAAYCAFMWYHGWNTEAAKPAPVAVPECFHRLLHHAYGMTMGHDWNKGTMAGHHREKLCRAVEDCRAAMLKAGPVTGWIKCSERMPANKEGLWSKEVIALSDLGEPFKLSAMGGYWQRTQAFIDSGARSIVCWMPIPTEIE